MSRIGGLKPLLDAKKESHNVTCRTPFAEGEGFISHALRRVRDYTPNPLSTLYFLGVPVSPAFQRLTMAVAVFDALSSSSAKVTISSGITAKESFFLCFLGKIAMFLIVGLMSVPFYYIQ